MTGTLSDAWSAVIGDRVAAWRLTNAAKTQKKVQKEFDKLGLKPDANRIPERYAITWFEEASKQDEDEIQDLFARLLARAAAGDHDALDRRNLEIVSKLTPNDAALFMEMAAGGWGARRTYARPYWSEKSGRFFTNKPTTVDIEKFSRSFEHLITLGLLSRQTQSGKKLNERNFRTGPYVETIVENVVILTDTGISLYHGLKDADAPEAGAPDQGSARFPSIAKVD
ncbi:MAG: Abi-alpha family protein [Pseudomonadota bacterium]